MGQVARKESGKREITDRNSRIKEISKSGWSGDRLAKFKKNLTFAAAAKACRTALQVSGQEVADHFDVSACTVYNWESGVYCWHGGEKELFEYMNSVRQIAA